LTEVDWEMLEKVEHRPLVILRLESGGPTNRSP
jgi:F420-0:gamma-glutamyl ligase-like protein